MVRPISTPLYWPYQFVQWATGCTQSAAVDWEGLTEGQAKAQGIKVKKGLFPWAASGRAIANDLDERRQAGLQREPQRGARVV